MIHVVLYEKSTGRLLSTRISTARDNAADFETESVGAIAVSPIHPIFQEGETRYRLLDGRIEPKQRLTFTTATPTFEADGETVCSVTCPVPEPLTVLVGGEELEISPEDDTIEITADTPQRITVTFPLHPLYWAAPLTVEAL